MRHSPQELLIFENNITRFGGQYDAVNNMPDPYRRTGRRVFFSPVLKIEVNF